MEVEAAKYTKTDVNTVAGQIYAVDEKRIRDRHKNKNKTHKNGQLRKQLDGAEVKLLSKNF